MTANQTIDGVRTLAEQACGTSPDSPEYRRFIAAMNPTLLLDLTSPAAQPQGDPVALLSKGFTTLETRDGKYRIIMQYKNRDDAWSDYTALCKAEQPAPVAVVLPERREPTQDNPYLSDADHEWNAYRDELKRLNPSL